MFDKDDQENSQLIDTSLEAVLSGKATLEQVLAEHPEQAAMLRPELEAAMWLVSRRDQVSPRAGFISSSRKRVIERIKQEANSSSAKRSIFGFIWPQKIAYQWVAALVALIILFSGTNGLVQASQAALPGDDLYAVKRATEQIALTLTSNDIERVELSAQYAGHRLAEVMELVRKGDTTGIDDALEAFENQVTNTVAMLKSVSNAKAHEKKELAATLEQGFNQQAANLDSLQASAPMAYSSQIDHAQEVAILGAAMAADEAAKIVDPLATPTSTSTSTATPTTTATPQPSATPYPTRTQHPGIYGEPDENDPTMDPDYDPTDPYGRKATKTPKPANNNRRIDPGKPEKTDKPDKPDKTTGNK